MDLQHPLGPPNVDYPQQYLEGINPKKAMNVSTIFFRK